VTRHPLGIFGHRSDASAQAGRDFRSKHPGAGPDGFELAEQHAGNHRDRQKKNEPDRGPCQRMKPNESRQPGQYGAELRFRVSVEIDDGAVPANTGKNKNSVPPSISLLKAVGIARDMDWMPRRTNRPRSGDRPGMRLSPREASSLRPV
jgi:hypothetical protein